MDDLKPWEKYGAAPTAQPAAGVPAPWEKYAGQPVPAAALDAPTPAPAPESPPQQPARTGLAETGHRLGVLGRGLVTGATGMAGLAGDALNTTLNALNWSGRMPRLDMPSAALQSAMTSAGVPQAENTPERIAQFAASLAAGSRDPAASLLTRNLPPAAAPTLSDRQQNISQAQTAGYKLLPSQTGEAGFTARMLEKFANKDNALRFVARPENQAVTDRLARSAAGLSDDAPLTADTLNSAISSTYTAGYKPIEQLGRITTGGAYRRALDKALSDFQGASRSFPAAVRNDVRDLIDGYRVRAMDAGDTVAAIQRLREEGTALYAANPKLAGANKAIATALENNIELNLNARGQDGADMLAAFRAARVQLAKQYVVRNVLKEGPDSANALRIAAQLNRNPGRLTNELALIGKMGNLAPSTMGIPAELPRSSGAPIVQSLLAAHFGGPGAGAAVASLPAGRSLARAAILSPWGQRAIGPATDPGMLSRLMSNPGAMNAMPTLLQQLQGGLFGPNTDPYQQPQPQQ